MKTKFKVGDVIKTIDPSFLETFTITDVIFGRKEVTGNWGYCLSMLVEDSYVVYNQDGYLYYLPIVGEDRYTLISSGSLLKTEVVGFSNICPRCQSPLVEKLSIGLGEMIKKCSNPDCGWC